MFLSPASRAPFLTLLQSRWMLLAWLLAGACLPALLVDSLPLDVVEGITWGKEWQWGYYKHPPLPAWAVYVAFKALGRLGPFVLSTLCTAAALAYVYALGRRLMARERAAAGTVLLLGVFYYLLPNTLEFNHNIAQIPLWAAIGYHFHAATQDGRWRDWVLLGLYAGLGMLTKYSMAMLLVCLAAYLLATPLRRWLLRPQPWVSVGMAAAIFAPHLWWLVHDDWLPIAYATARAREAASGTPRLRSLTFLAAQGINHMPMLLIVLLSASVRGFRLRRPVSGDTPFLLTLVFGPALLTGALGLVFGLGLRGMWGAPMWNFSGLLLVSMIPQQGFAQRLPRLVYGTSLWLGLVTIGMFIYLTLGPQWRSNPPRVSWPARAVAAQAQQQWASVSACPLRIVAGSYWLAGLVAVQAPTMPSVLIDEDPRYAPWITPQRLREQGALWVWNPHVSPSDQVVEPALLQDWRNTGVRTAQGQFVVAWPQNPAWEPMRLSWRAYVPAHCHTP